MIKKHISAFRDKYLAVVLAAALLLVSAIAQSQVYQSYPPFGAEFKRIQSLLTFNPPYGATNTLNGGKTVPGALFYNTTDSSYHVWTGTQFLKIAKGGDVVTASSSTAKPDTIEMFRLNVAANTSAAGWTKGTQYNTSSTETVVASGLQIVNNHTGAITTNYVYNGGWESIANDGVVYTQGQVVSYNATNPRIGLVHEGATDIFNVDNFGYVDLSDDSVMIQTYTGIHAVGKLSRPIAAGDVIRMRFRRAFDVFTFTLENLTKALPAESFTYDEAGGAGTSTITNIYPGLMVQNGTFIVHQFNYYANNFRPDIIAFTDSRLHGQKLTTPFDSTYGGRFVHFSGWKMEMAGKSANKIEDYIQSVNEWRKFQAKYYLVDVMYNNLVTGGEDTAVAGPKYLQLIDSIKNNGGHAIVVQTAPANNDAPTEIFNYIRDHFQNDPSVHILNLFNTTNVYKGDTTNFYNQRYFVDAGIHFNEDGQQELFNYTRRQLEYFMRSRPVGSGTEIVYNNAGQFGATRMYSVNGSIGIHKTAPTNLLHIGSSVLGDSVITVNNNIQAAKFSATGSVNQFPYSFRTRNTSTGTTAGDGFRAESHDGSKFLALTWNNVNTTVFNPSRGVGDIGLLFHSGNDFRFATSTGTAAWIFGFNGTVATNDRVFLFHDSTKIRSIEAVVTTPSKYNSVLVYDSVAGTYGHGRIGHVPLATFSGGGGGSQGLEDVLTVDPVLTTSHNITHAGIEISGTSDMELQSNTLLSILGAGSEMRFRDSIEVDWSGSTSKVFNLGANLAKNQLANDSMLTYNPGTGRASYKAIPTANVTKVGTPVNNQLGIWTGDGTIKGETTLTYNGSNELLVGTSTDQGTYTLQVGGPLHVNTTGTVTSFQMNNVSNLYAEVRFSQAGTTRYVFGHGGSSAIAPYAGNAYHQLATGSNNFVWINSSNSTIATLSNAGKLGIGATPTAYLHLPAGTTAATTAPLKFTAGTNMTAAEAGAMEWDGTNLFVTQNTGPTRKTIAYTTDLATSGTYTPTLTNTTNITSSTANANTTYERTGNRVCVSGSITVTPTAELLDCVLGFSLPVASSITDYTQGGGVGALEPNGVAHANGVSIKMDATNDRATFTFYAPSDGSAIILTFNFCYSIL